MQENHFNQITLSSNDEMIVAALAAKRDGHEEVAQIIGGEVRIPMLLAPDESEIIRRGLKSIVNDPHFPAFRQAQARGMLSGRPKPQN